MVNVRAVSVTVEAKRICKRIISDADNVHGLKTWNDFQDLSKCITSLTPL